MKMTHLFAAAALAFAGLGLTAPASAQPGWQNGRPGHHVNNRNRHHKVKRHTRCRTVWHNHHRVRRCR